MFWENSPTETTPLSASNLSRMEKYTTATAGSNGDFYVTINNSSGLATGDVVKISFPTATDNTADARLSIDGGSNYKNIYDELNSANILASEVENQSLELRYNGSQFINTDTSGEMKLLLSNSTTSYATATVSLKKYKQIVIALYDGTRPNSTNVVSRAYFETYCTDAPTSATVEYDSNTAVAYYSGGILSAKIFLGLTVKVYGVL